MQFRSLQEFSIASVTVATKDAHVDAEVRQVISEGEARQGAELVCASGVLAVGSAPGPDYVFLS